jgi:zinc protease
MNQSLCALKLGSIALAALLCAPAFAPAQAASNPAQAQPWKSIPIPPLPPFHPAQPKRIQLKNGAVIFLAEDHELPFISGFIEMKGGSRDEPAAKTGLVELYGATWRTSGTAAQNGDKLDDILEAKAAKVETGGDIDSTSVAWNCLKQDEDQVFGIVVDLLEHPAFSENKLKLAQQQMAAGIVRRNDGASEIASREAARLVYGTSSPYGRQPEIATMMSVAIADLKAWHQRTVVPNGMIIGVSGDFDSAAMEKTLRATFETLPEGKPIVEPKEDFPGPRPGVYFVEKSDVNQSNIRIVGLGTERSNPDYYALSVMNEIFSGGFGSRLFQDVRTKRGLAYSVGGAYGASYDHPGIFSVGASTKSATTVATAQAILDDIKELKTEPFTEDELKRAKDQVLNSFIFRYDSVEKVLNEQAKLEFYNYPLDSLAKYREGVEKVTTADLDRVAKKYIDPSKLAVLVVGNSSEFGTPLSTLGPVKPIDITIPMPPGMAGPQGPGGDPNQ